MDFKQIRATFTGQNSKPSYGLPTQAKDPSDNPRGSVKALVQMYENRIRENSSEAERHSVRNSSVGRLSEDKTSPYSTVPSKPEDLTRNRSQTSDTRQGSWLKPLNQAEPFSIKLNKIEPDPYLKPTNTPALNPDSNKKLATKLNLKFDQLNLMSIEEKNEQLEVTFNPQSTRFDNIKDGNQGDNEIFQGPSESLLDETEKEIKTAKKDEDLIESPHDSDKRGRKRKKDRRASDKATKIREDDEFQKDLLELKPSIDLESNDKNVDLREVHDGVENGKIKIEDLEGRGFAEETEKIEESVEIFDEEKSDEERKIRKLERSKRRELRRIEKEKLRLIEIERQQLEELERQKLDELERQKVEELERQKLEELERQKLEELERQRLEKLERQRLEKLERQRLEKLERQRLEELERQRLEELERQQLEELERQRLEELERQQLEEIERQRLEELERQKSEELERQQIKERKKKSERKKERKNLEAKKLLEQSKEESKLEKDNSEVTLISLDSKNEDLETNNFDQEKIKNEEIEITCEKNELGNGHAKENDESYYVLEHHIGENVNPESLSRLEKNESTNDVVLSKFNPKSSEVMKENYGNPDDEQIIFEDYIEPMVTMSPTTSAPQAVSPISKNNPDLFRIPASADPSDFHPSSAPTLQVHSTPVLDLPSISSPLADLASNPSLIPLTSPYSNPLADYSEPSSSTSQAVQSPLHAQAYNDFSYQKPAESITVTEVLPARAAFSSRPPIIYPKIRSPELHSPELLVLEIDVTCINCYECVRPEDIDSHSTKCIKPNLEVNDSMQADIRLRKLLRSISTRKVSSQGSKFNLYCLLEEYSLAILEKTMVIFT